MANCTSTAPNNYGASSWVAGQLPIRYQLANTKWPVNTEDTEDFFHTVAQNGGYAQLELAGTYETYVNKEYVKITDSTLEQYNGVWQITQIVDSQTIVINAPFVGAANGTVQRYYNNYHIQVRVYTGIPPGHYLESQRPMALRTTLKFRPDADNTVEADIGSVVRADLTPINCKLCDILEAGQKIGNDWYNWTAFYIAYAESYDVSNGSTVSTFTSAFTNSTSGGSINYQYASNSSKQFQDFTGWSMGEYVLADYNTLLASKFLSTWAKPTLFDGEIFDLQILSQYDSTDFGANEKLIARVTERDSAGATVATTDIDFPAHDAGYYRIALSEHSFTATCTEFTVQVYKVDTGTATETALSEAKELFRQTDKCGPDPVVLKWINPLGGWDYWLFRRGIDYGIEVGDRQLVRRDVAQDWDTTFRTGDTEDDYIFTEAYNSRVLRSQVLTDAEMDQVNKFLRISNKVFEVYFANDAGCGNYDQRAVLVQTSSFTVRRSVNKYNEVAITVRNTDRLRQPEQ